MKRWLFFIMAAMGIALGSLPMIAFSAEQEGGEAWIQENARLYNESSSSVGLEKSESELKSGTCGENLIWELENGVLTISGNGPMEDFKYFNGSSSPFYGERSKIETVIIQNGITYIGNAAFWQCGRLKSIIIPDSVTGIGDYAFYQCSSLKNIAIPSSVTDIKLDSFFGCSSLTEITIESGNANYSSKDGVLFNKQKTCLITCPGGKSGAYKIPDSVKIIGEGAFHECRHMKKVEIPMGVKTIGEGAFSGCTWITEVAISDSVTDIGKGAFYGCRSLTGIVIPGSVTTIGDAAFRECAGIMNIVISDGVTDIGGYAFYECGNIRDIVIPDSVTNVGGSAFGECTSLRSIMFSAGMTEISNQILDSCTHLNCVYIPSSITKIGYGSFDRCSLRYICYGGDENGWKSMKIGSSNGSLTRSNAPICYNQKRDYKIYNNSRDTDNFEIFDRSLEMCISKTSSTEYNPQLAHMLIAMCNSVYKLEDMTETFRDFGFLESGHSYNVTGEIMLAYGMANKQIGDRTLVLVVARGTENFLEDPIEWISNFHALTNDKKQHTGFADAANALYDRMTDFLGTTDFSNVDFVLTGFSRGAAAANILAARLITDEKVSKYNVYTYAFACPDTIKEYEYSPSYDSIFNIADANDLVSWLPGAASISDWKKYGVSHWFSKNWNDFENLAVDTVVDMVKGKGAHDQAKYLSYLRSEKPVAEYRERSAAKSALNEADQKRLEKMYNIKNTFLGCVGIHCPVDVEIYASDDTLVGSIKNSIIYVMDSDKLYISILDGKKNIYLLDGDTYTFRMAATDKGTMDYSVQNIRVSDQNVVESQNFANVTLVEGKEMSSTVKFQNLPNAENDARIDVPSVHLYVLDENGDVKSEVQPGNDGIETPVIPAEDNPDVPGNTADKTDEDNLGTPGNTPANKQTSIKVKKIKISGLSHKIASGKKISLTAAVSPSNATNKAVVWKSSNTKYAAVNSKGIVIMKKAGKGKTVKITAIAKDGSGKKAAYKLKCMKGTVRKIVILGKKTISVKAGKSVVLKTKVTASAGANKALHWKSSNARYATVNKKGKMTAKKAGKGKTVKIAVMATDGSGKKAAVKIKIR